MIKPFGIPAWKHCKKRLAKKIIKSRGRDMWKRYQKFHNYKGLVSGCNGLNMEPVKMIPLYLGKNKTKIIWDIDLISKYNSCSFYHCGIDKPKSYQECLDYINLIVNGPDDDFGIKERYKKIKIDENGIVIQ